MENILNIHPGEILKEEFMEPLKISQYKLAKDIHVQEIQISKIIRGQGLISYKMAFKLSRYFGNSVEFWINLCTSYERRKLANNTNFQTELSEIQAFKVSS